MVLFSNFPIYSELPEGKYDTQHSIAMHAIPFTVVLHFDAVFLVMKVMRMKVLVLYYH